ncbi:peroxisomal membrane protein 11C [Lingula anatina]|uniref:Peroxisomal membrane protein 11C n=1 Tax=Lingula anatina TaxID=7574 RepID=A0A1S3JE48_LINAN|nr:peroxisomal membrane protein 11C [Lingula anatina]|eukprot:XP_013408603.1 peroxisomal membrane protein 11C [Lingula anatina]
MEAYVNLIQTYRGRDKMIRLCTYAATFLSGASRGKLAEKFGALAIPLGKCRVVLRLFDDLPMILYARKLGLMKQEKNLLLQLLGVAQNIANLCYFPVEHIAFGGDLKLWDVNSPKWWTTGIAIWATSLITGILRSLIKIILLRQERHKLAREQGHEGREDPDLSSVPKFSVRKLKKEELDEILAFFKNSFDLLNAVNWLPKGFLWAGKFSTMQSGLWGLISTSIGLYELYSQAKEKTS